MRALLKNAFVVSQPLSTFCDLKIKVEIKGEVEFNPSKLALSPIK